MAEQDLQERRRERERALQVLPAMLNLILVRTGKAFKDPARYAHKDGSRGAPMAQVVQGAMEGFHGALDALEIELLQAKAALSQDLADLRAKEAEAQKRSDAENETETAILPAASQEVNEVAAPSIEIQPIEPGRNHDNTVTITIEDDEPDKATPQVARNLTKLTEEIPRFSPVMSSPPAPPPPEVIEISDPGKSNKDVVKQEERQEVVTTTSQAPLQDELSATSALNEMDFESMFPDITGDGGTSGLELDLHFSADSSLDHDTLVGQGFNMEPSTILKNATKTANDEMDALLPGLGSYASAVDEIGVIEVPIATTTNATATTPVKVNIDLSGQGVSTNLESTTIDDLFADSADFNFNDETTAGENGSAFDVGAGGEFDDALFGLEGS